MQSDTFSEILAQGLLINYSSLRSQNTQGARLNWSRRVTTDVVSTTPSYNELSHRLITEIEIPLFRQQPEKYFVQVFNCMTSFMKKESNVNTPGAPIKNGRAITHILEQNE